MIDLDLEPSRQWADPFVHSTSEMIAKPYHTGSMSGPGSTSTAMPVARSRLSGQALVDDLALGERSTNHHKWVRQKIT